MSRNPNAPRNNTGCLIVSLILILVFIAGSALMVKLCIDLIHYEPKTTDRPGTSSGIQMEITPEETEPPTETTVPDPVPESVVATATIAATGDLLMHEPVITSGKKTDGTYNFDSIFQYLKEYSSAVDFATANLETTLFGPGKPYKGYPMFNCPDDIVTGAIDAGFDMLLTGNNHSFDTGLEGYLRTIDVVRDAGIPNLGTMKDENDPKWHIAEINGIKIGLISYTYETSNGAGEYPALNGLPMYGATYENINCFRMEAPQPFFDEVKGYLAEMEAAGAEATVLFIHWGVEYQLKQNSQQTAIAQGLCDLGVDVIIGGHPHVVQPVDLLTSTVDENHKTVCLYSMGNAVSNQRLGNLQSVSTAHTEDGVFFSVTFEKYSDGEVYLVGTDLLPTWVDLRYPSTGKEYAIIPLDYDRVDEWESVFNLAANTLNAAKNSYARTMAIVEEGLTECQTYLAQAKTDREEYYYNLAWHPEMFETQPTEEVTEATEVVEETTEAANAA